jgi:predicted alpha/beta superfamily hydrolase
MRTIDRARLSGSFFVFLLAVLFSSPSAFGQPAGTDIVIGKTITFPSKVFNADLPISIHLPSAYDATEAKYPVLYDLNAFACFTYGVGTVEFFSRSMEIPEMIVVGLPSLEDGYVPTPYEKRGTEPMTADLSLKFFSEELIPFINSNYRTAGFNILSGHSVAGLFTAYALFTRPDLFSAGIASSPWFQTNDQYWLKQIDQMFQAESLADKYLFLTVGKKEQELTISTYTELEKWMKAKDLKGLTWKSEWLDDVDHGSMLGLSLYNGLRFIFNGWKIPFNVIVSGDVSAIEAHAAKMKAKYGGRLAFDISESLLNQVGYQLLNRKTYDRAINILTLNLKLHPNSPNTYDSLAEGYLIMGDKEKAIKYYELAIQKNPGKTDFEKRILQNARDKLKELKQ